MPSVNERLLDETIAHAVDLQLYANGVVRRIIALLNRADADIAARLADLGAVESFSVERLDSLLQSVRQLNARAYAAVGDELAAEMRRLVEHEAGYQLSLFQSVIPAQVVANVGLAAVQVEQVYAAALARPFQGRLLREWAQSLEADRAARIRDAVRMGFVEQETIPQIVRRVRGTKAKAYSDGIISIDRRNAEAVVRTAISHTAGVVRDRFMEANSDLIKAEEWCATLDARTSEQCFPGSTEALPIGNLVAVTSRVYKGELVVVTTASGKQLRATPNHPVLTARGWRPIKELTPGDDVLYRVVSESAGVGRSEHVSVPPTIGAIADALSKPTIGYVLVESTSEADFHGDGKIGQHKVNIPAGNGDLCARLDSAGLKNVSEHLLRGVAVGGDFARLCDDGFLRVGNESVCMSSEFDSAPVQDRVKAALANAESHANCGRRHSLLESGNDLGFVAPLGRCAATERRHYAGSLENASDSRCRDAVFPSDRAGACAVRVLRDDVVSVGREFFSDGHVYNLSTSTEWYIADGFIVHNCRIRDKKRYTPGDHKPIGHSIPWRAGPGRLHWNCRSCSAPITKSWRELGIDLDELPDTDRASMDGTVPAETSFGDWIKRQSAGRQDQILGATRGALLRRGGLDLDRFYTDKGRYLSLPELREREAAAFGRAGV